LFAFEFFYTGYILGYLKTAAIRPVVIPHGKVADVQEFALCLNPKFCCIAFAGSEIIQYLLSTAILDRFCGPLCEALCVQGAEPLAREINGWEFIAINDRTTGNVWIKLVLVCAAVSS